MTANDMQTPPRHQLQNQSLQPSQSQAQLPSFREIIPPLLKTSLDIHHPQHQQEQQPQHRHHHHRRQPQPQHQQRQFSEARSGILTPTARPVPGASSRPATSTIEHQHSSMPSLPEAFEDVSVRGNDVMFATQTQPMATMDRGSSWMPTSQYQNMSASFTQPAQRMSQTGSQQVSTRTSPNLPSLRDSIQRSSSGFDQTYGTTAGQMTYVTQAGAYPQLYSSTPQTSTDIDTTFGTRNLSYDGAQYARFTNAYPQTTRSYQTNDFSRFNTGTYDPYRYNTGYRTSYGDMNYSPHAMVSSQPASYGVTGDLANAHNRRRRGNLPKNVTDILRSWFHDHLDHPYPSEEDKQIFIQKTGLTISQISNWFINARRRHWPALRQNRDRARNSALRRSNSAGTSV